MSAKEMRKKFTTELDAGKLEGPGIEVLHGVQIPTLELIIENGFSQEAAESIVARQRKRAEKAAPKPVLVPDPPAPQSEEGELVDASALLGGLNDARNLAITILGTLQSELVDDSKGEKPPGDYRVVLAGYAARVGLVVDVLSGKEPAQKVADDEIDRLKGLEKHRAHLAATASAPTCAVQHPADGARCELKLEADGKPHQFAHKAGWRRW